MLFGSGALKEGEGFRVLPSEHVAGAFNCSRHAEAEEGGCSSQDDYR